MKTADPSDTPPVPQNRSRKKWWMLGCGGCLGSVAFGILGIFGLVTYVVKHSDAYPEIQSRAEKSAELTEAIGSPISYGSVFQGGVSYKNGGKSMDVSIPIEGPKGKGHIVVKAYKPPGADDWAFSVLEAEVPGGKVINLIPRPSVRLGPGIEPPGAAPNAEPAPAAPAGAPVPAKP